MDVLDFICSTLSFRDLIYIYHKMVNFNLSSNTQSFLDYFYRYHNLDEMG